MLVAERSAIGWTLSLARRTTIWVGSFTKKWALWFREFSMAATQRCLPTGLPAVERLIPCRFDKTKENLRVDCRLFIEKIKRKKWNKINFEILKFEIARHWWAARSDAAGHVYNSLIVPKHWKHSRDLVLRGLYGQAFWSFRAQRGGNSNFGW